MIKSKFKDGPKFMAISTGGASLTKMIPLSNGPYGSSKAALNFIMKKIAWEEKDNGLIAIALSPGTSSPAQTSQSPD
jgi:NAD(P)-dependent dehydrogenase (short-subunit alcohol dehydrogenase family)